MYKAYSFLTNFKQNTINVNQIRRKNKVRKNKSVELNNLNTI